MSYDFVIDTYAWMEYFRGSEEGKIAQKYIENENSATSAVTIAELSEKYKRENKDFEDDFSFIIVTTKIMNLDSEIALIAGEINCENKKKIKNWGMSDSIILATAKLLNAKVVTGDEHFKRLNSVMLK
jgi:predicted nucleic acid-binding protein